MDIQKLIAQKREVLGRKVSALRQKQILPGNLYGKKIKSQALQVQLDDFLSVFKEAGETGVINLSFAGGKGETTSVLVANVQKNPVTDAPIHVDFRKVDLKEKITASVPVGFVGEAPCEKTGVGTVVQYVDEVEVEALPTDLPEKFEIDVSGLAEVDQAILLKDLKFDRTKITLQDDLEKIVAKVEPPQKIEEEVPTPLAEEVGTTAQEGEPVAEEMPAEGENSKEENPKSET